MKDKDNLNLSDEEKEIRKHADEAFKAIGITEFEIAQSAKGASINREDQGKVIRDTYMDILYKHYTVIAKPNYKSKDGTIKEGLEMDGVYYAAKVDLPILPIPHNEGGPILKDFLWDTSGKDWDEFRNEMCDKLDQELFKDIVKQSEMKTIEIDWKKIYEVNPEGLLEWLGHVPKNKTPFTCKSVKVDEHSFVCDFGEGYSRNYTITFGTLNAKALDLIFWFDSKGFHISVTPVFQGGKEIDFKLVVVTNKPSFGGVIEEFTDRPTAYAAGIIKAFELLNDKP